MYFKYYRKLDLHMLEAMANKLQKYKERWKNKYYERNNGAHGFVVLRLAYITYTSISIQKCLHRLHLATC